MERTRIPYHIYYTPYITNYGHAIYIDDLTSCLNKLHRFSFGLSPISSNLIWKKILCIGDSYHWDIGFVCLIQGWELQSITTFMDLTYFLEKRWVTDTLCELYLHRLSSLNISSVIYLKESLEA